MIKFIQLTIWVRRGERGNVEGDFPIKRDYQAHDNDSLFVVALTVNRIE